MVMWEMGFNDGRVCLAMSSVLKSELKKKCLKISYLYHSI